jgi:hypothetical protein
MLVGREEHPIPVVPVVGELGQDAQAEQVGRGIQRQTLIRAQALAGGHLRGDGVQQGVTEARQIDPDRHRISLEERNKGTWKIYTRRDFHPTRELS